VRIRTAVLAVRSQLVCGGMQHHSTLSNGLQHKKYKNFKSMKESKRKHKNKNKKMLRYGRSLWADAKNL
jgi:hypothetical protein